MRHTTLFQRITFFLVLIVATTTIDAQGPLTIEAFENSHEATALQMPRITEEGVAAIVKIVAPATVTEVQGNVTTDDTGIRLLPVDNEMWVWMFPGSSQMKVVLEDGRTADVDFSRFGVGRLVARNTYYLVITDSKTTSGGMGQLQFENTSNGTIFIDGKEIGQVCKTQNYHTVYMLHNNIVSGCHTLLLRDKERTTVTRRILVRKNSLTRLSIDFKKRGAQIRLSENPFAKKMIAGIKQSVPITARRCVINDVRPERLYLSGDIQNGTRDDIIYDGVASSGFDFNTLREDKEQLKEELRSIVLPVSKDRIGLYQIAVTTKSNVKVYIYEDPNKFPSDLFEMTYSTDEILQALEQSMKMP